MRITFISLFISFSLLLFSQNDSGWSLVKQQKGIDVYVKKIPESPINAVKAAKIINCSLASAVAVLLDVANHHKWMYQCKIAEVVNRVNDSTWFYYAHTSTPWPVLNRDYVSKIVIKKNDANSISIIGMGAPDYLPEKEDVIRLPYSVSEWKFTTIGPKKIYAELYLSIDVGGTVPAWLLNLFISRGPYQTILNFSNRVHDKKYQNTTLPYYIK